MEQQEPTASPFPLSSTQVDALYAKAAQLQMAGHLKPAEHIYQRLISAGCDRADVLSNLALIYKNTNRTQAACILLDQALALHSDQPFLYHNYANLRYQLGDYAVVVELEQKAISLGAGGVDVWLTLATAHESLGDVEAARFANQQALQRHPHHPTALLNLGALEAQVGNLQAAEALTREAIVQAPTQAKPQMNLGKVLFQQGKLEAACQAWQKALRLEPGNPEPWLDLTQALLELGHAEQLEQPMRAVLQGVQESDLRARLLIALSGVLRDQGRFSEAIASVQEAVRLAPERADVHEALGSLLQANGDLAAAEQALRKALQLDGERCVVAIGQLVQQLRGRCEPALAEQLLALNEECLVQVRDRIQICFAKSQLFHARKEYESSSRYLVLANREKLRLFPSDADELMERAQRQAEAADQLDTCTNAEAGAGRLFIVGMPRSGTTLLESVLSMNPAVTDLGEVPALRQALQRWEKGGSTAPFAHFYDAACSTGVLQADQWSTDKWLYNYALVGQIARLLPAARIFHCVRHPYDNLLSIARANFLRGNRYSSCVVDSARVLLQHHNLMSGARKRYPNQIYTVNYDQLVSDPNHEIRQIIWWLGWAWDDVYLCPETNTRAVATASLIQVRSPINAQSLGGWKFYRDFLRPAESILGDPSECWPALLLR